VQLGETGDRGAKEKPKRASLTNGLTESTVTLEDAIKLLELPREIGRHPDSGQSVLAGLGRFGPYVKHGDDYRSLAAEDDLFTVDLDRALTLLAEPKKAGRRQVVKRVIRTIEASDGGTPLEVLEGRYGPYVTDGETNASIPQGTDPSTLSLADARGLIEARHGAAPRRGRRGATPKRRAARAAGATAEGVAVERATAAGSKSAPKTRATRKPAASKTLR
jgi:DNA topoisomerase-1